jgi:hypothetical protein
MRVKNWIVDWQRILSVYKKKQRRKWEGFMMEKQNLNSPYKPCELNWLKWLIYDDK